MQVFREFPNSAIAIFAHPGDAELSCAGTLAAFSHHGAETTLVIVTQGDKGQGEGSTSSLIASRRKEAEVAAKSLGIGKVVFLERLDGEFENDLDLRRELVSLIRASEADCVITSDPDARIFGDFYINHRDHRVVGTAVLDVVQAAAGNERYFPETGAPFDPSVLLLAAGLEPNVCVDISESIDQKVDAMVAHESQVGMESEIAELVKTRARDASSGSTVELAESFRRIEFI